MSVLAHLACLVTVASTLVACSASSAPPEREPVATRIDSGNTGGAADESSDAGSDAPSADAGDPVPACEVDGSVGVPLVAIRYDATKGCFEQDVASALHLCAVEKEYGTDDSETACVLDASGTAFALFLGSETVTVLDPTGCSVESYPSASGACVAMYAAITAYSGSWGGNIGPPCGG